MILIGIRWVLVYSHASSNKQLIKLLFGFIHYFWFSNELSVEQIRLNVRVIEWFLNKSFQRLKRKFRILIKSACQKFHERAVIRHSESKSYI